MHCYVVSSSWMFCGRIKFRSAGFSPTFLFCWCAARIFLFVFLAVQICYFFITMAQGNRVIWVGIHMFLLCMCFEPMHYPSSHFSFTKGDRNLFSTQLYFPMISHFGKLLKFKFKLIKRRQNQRV